jgi:NADPH-dependent F420 reductase
MINERKFIMILGVIGSGKIGRSIGKWAAKAGYDVIFSARDMSHADEAAKEAGNNAGSGSVRDVTGSADMILLAVPYRSVKDILKESGTDLKGKILIDVTNPLNQDYSGLAVGLTTSAAEEIQKSVPEAKVVKAFNTIFAAVFESRNPEINGKKVAVFYASDDETAKSKVAGLITKMGFDAVDTGPLKSARTLEPLALLNINLGYGMGHGTSIGFAFLH